MIYDEVFNFPDWILCYHELFHNNVKNQRKISIDLNFQNYNHEKYISCEYASNNYSWTL